MVMQREGDSVDTDAYERIGLWYDLEHDSLTDDIESFAEVISALPQQRPAILELGSGSGRVVAGLALAGYSVTGVEPSVAMRERCASRMKQLPERVSRRVRIVEGSATALHLAPNDIFDAALFSLNTFAHLLTLDERLEALTQTRQQLRPGAKLIIDLDLLGPRRLRETSGRLWWQGTWQVPESSEQVSHFVAAAPNTNEPGILRLAHFYDVAAQNDVIRRTISRMSLALLSLGELEVTLRQTHYALEAVYGSYDLAPYDESVGHALIVAQREA